MKSKWMIDFGADDLKDEWQNIHWLAKVVHYMLSVVVGVFLFFCHCLCYLRGFVVFVGSKNISIDYVCADVFCCASCLWSVKYCFDHKNNCCRT